MLPHCHSLSKPLQALVYTHNPQRRHWPTSLREGQNVVYTMTRFLVVGFQLHMWQCELCRPRPRSSQHNELAQFPHRLVMPQNNARQMQHISLTELSCSKHTPNSSPAPPFPHVAWPAICSPLLPVSSRAASISSQSVGVSLLCFVPSSSEPSVFPALLHRFLDPLSVFLAVILVQVTGFDVCWGSGIRVVKKAGPACQ